MGEKDAPVSNDDDNEQDVHMRTCGDALKPPMSWAANEVQWDGYKCQAVSNGGARQHGCQVPGCSNPLEDLKKYYKRHRICEQHMGMDVMEVDGVQQRFCQQCGRFQALVEFDGTRRTCRMRLSSHNERRRQLRAAATAATLRAEELATNPPLMQPRISARSSGPGTSPDEMDSPVVPLFYAALPLKARKHTAMASPNSSSASSGTGSHAAATHSSTPTSITTGHAPAPPGHQKPHLATNRPRLAPPQSTPKHPSDPTSHPQLASLIHAHISDAPTTFHINCQPVIKPTPQRLGSAPPSPHLPHATNTVAAPHALYPPHGMAPALKSHLAYGMPYPPQHRSMIHPRKPLHPQPSLGNPQGSYDPSASTHYPPPTSYPPLHPCEEPYPQRRKLNTSSAASPPSLYTISACVPNHPTTLPQPMYETLIAVPLSSNPLHSYSSPYPSPYNPPPNDIPRLLPNSRARPHSADLLPPSGPQSYPPPSGALQGHPRSPIPPLGGPTTTVDSSSPSPQPPSSSPPTPAPSDPSAPITYEAMEYLISFSLKIFNTIPSQLPLSLREHLHTLAQDALHLEASIRPGCVHLTVDAFAPRGAPPPCATDLARRLPLLDPFWSSAKLLVQNQSSACALYEGALHPLPLSMLPPSSSTRAGAPATAAISPICLWDPQLQPVTLSCPTPPAGGAPSGPLRVFCRCAGQHLSPDGLTPEVVTLGPPAPPAPEGHGATSAPPSMALTFHIPPPPTAGVMVRVDAAAGQAALVSSTHQVVLVVHSKEIATEVCSLEAPALAHLIPTALPDLGRVLEFRNHLLTPPGLPPSRTYTPREQRSLMAAARQLLALSVTLRWPHVAAALQPIAALSAEHVAEALLPPTDPLPTPTPTPLLTPLSPPHQPHPAFAPLPCPPPSPTAAPPASRGSSGTPPQHPLPHPPLLQPLLRHPLPFTLHSLQSLVFSAGTAPPPTHAPDGTPAPDVPPFPWQAAPPGLLVH